MITAIGVCTPATKESQSVATPSAARRSASQWPNGSSPTPPASAASAPERAAETATLASAPPKEGRNSSASAGESSSRSQMRSTIASPRQRITARQTMRRGSRLAAVELEHVIVGGTRIAYRRGRGEGRPTLFVHGIPTDSRQWLPFLERAGSEAIAVDLPGCGASERRPPAEFDYSMDGITRALRGFIDALGLGEYALVVQDWGGMGLARGARRT